MMNEEENYGPYDQYWCREFIPITRLISKLSGDNNRYHNFFVVQVLSFYKDRKWLVKPEGGFVNDEHKKFFTNSWKTNKKNKIAFYGDVYVDYLPSKRTWYGVKRLGAPQGVIANAAVPMLLSKIPDNARVEFENLWCNGGQAVRLWHTNDIVNRVYEIDKEFNAGRKTSARRAQFREQYCGWDAEDGSSPVLNIADLILE
jgi:hypothetical protein